MRIEDYKPSVETGGACLYEEEFQIGNIGRIMVILRNSMYSNPIKAIAREISCNARDAHREIGTPDRPIEIHIPNAFDEHYVVKDYGPGISHQRMAGVFIRYGISTKNDDDFQTGGFGLGAKTPFAYSDQFSITTTTKNPCQDGSNVKRIYIAYIDASSTGKMRLIAESPTDEETGTEISLVVAPDDWKKFAQATVEVCQYWNVLPILKGNGVPHWPDKLQSFFETKEYRLCKYSGYYNRRSLAIIDGIAYPLNPDNIFLSGENISLKREVVRQSEFFVNNGEMTLSANREELQYDTKTQKIINTRLDQILSEVKALAIDKIGNAPSYIEAVKNNIEIERNFQFALPDDYIPEWNGIKVKHNLKIEYPAIKEDDVKYHVEAFWARNNRQYKKQVSSREGSTINTIMQIIINDLSDSSIARSRIEYFMELNGYNPHDNNLVQVITFSKLDVEQGLKSFEKHNNFDLNILNPILLSSIDAPKKIKQKRNRTTSGRSLAKAFVFNLTYQGGRKCDHYWQPAEIDVEQGNGIYVITSGQNNVITSGEKDISYENMLFLIEYFKDIKVFAIRQKDKNDIGTGWIQLKDYIKNEIDSKLVENNLTSEQLIEFSEQIGAGYLDNFNTHYYSHFLIKKIEKITSVHCEGALYEYVKLSKQIYENNKKYEQLLKLMKIAGIDVSCKDKENLPLFALKDKINELYPILKMISIDIDHQFEAILKYVCLIDAELDRQSANGYIATTDGEENEY